MFWVLYFQTILCKIKIKKGEEDLKKFQKIVEEYIKDENNQKIVLKYWKTYIGFARREKDEKIENAIKKDGKVDDVDAAKFAQDLIDAFCMYILVSFLFFSHFQIMYM